MMEQKGKENSIEGKENSIEGNRFDFPDYLFLNYNTRNAPLDEIVSNTIHDSIREKIQFLSFVKCLFPGKFSLLSCPIHMLMKI